MCIDGITAGNTGPFIVNRSFANIKKGSIIYVEQAGKSFELQIVDSAGDLGFSIWVDTVDDLNEWFRDLRVNEEPRV